MFRPLPLPSRVPNITGEKRQFLNDVGVVLENSTETYVNYTLPDGWRMMDTTEHREDFPSYSIVDDDNNIRFVVYGVWKGIYDNELHWRFEEEPFKKYKSSKKEIIPNECRENVAEIKSLMKMDHRIHDLVSIGKKHKEEELKNIDYVQTSDFDEEFNSLVNAYHITIQTTVGCGSRGQIYVDAAYKKLEDYCKNKLGYKQRLAGIKKHIVQNDGYGGFACGFAGGFM